MRFDKKHPRPDLDRLRSSKKSLSEKLQRCMEPELKQKSINLTLRILAVAAKSDFSLNVLHSSVKRGGRKKLMDRKDEKDARRKSLTVIIFNTLLQFLFTHR